MKRAGCRLDRLHGDWLLKFNGGAGELSHLAAIVAQLVIAFAGSHVRNSRRRRRLPKNLKTRSAYFLRVQRCNLWRVGSGAEVAAPLLPMSWPWRSLAAYCYVLGDMRSIAPFAGPVRAALLWSYEAKAERCENNFTSEPPMGEPSLRTLTKRTVRRKRRAKAAVLAKGEIVCGIS